MLIYAAKRAKSILCKASHFEADRLSVAGESECLELEMRSRTKKLQQIQPTSTGPPPPPCTTANLVGGSDIAVHQLASGSCSGSLAGLRAAGGDCLWSWAASVLPVFSYIPRGGVPALRCASYVYACAFNIRVNVQCACAIISVWAWGARSE